MGCYLEKYHSSRSLGVMKLLQTGEQGDHQWYQALFPEVVTPVSYQAPLAPPLSAALEGKTVDLKPVWAAYQQLEATKDLLLIEALGGLGSPVTEELTVADLAQAWRLPIAIVVPVKLGAIAQVVANVALARHHKLEIKGIIFSQSQPCTPTQLEQWTPGHLIQNLVQIPVLGYLDYLENPRDRDQLLQAATQLNWELMGI
jgi:dethiobiotin synthetase